MKRGKRDKRDERKRKAGKSSDVVQPVGGVFEGQFICTGGRSKKKKKSDARD